jgi:hypothetical protein
VLCPVRTRKNGALINARECRWLGIPKLRRDNGNDGVAIDSFASCSGRARAYFSRAVYLVAPVLLAGVAGAACADCAACALAFLFAR